ncbi:tumor necrosis factor receptor superfamily member 14-like [Mixophyes fleayi]|uniref:tumor necrosis factor receptor superfamily member 14-like n=1 Tax=Mixophyes fleayi TaxID=3061075 RepID=UPI003F4D9C96
MEIWISAEMSFLIIILYLAMLKTIVFCCNPGEYYINDVCCPMCPPGNVVSVHCTTAISSTSCVPCIEGTYMDHPNGETKCLRCRDCDIGAGLVVKSKCTYTSDAVCQCTDGYFCSADDTLQCDLCQQYRTCEPGQYIKALGTMRTDTVCEDCPPGHFSNKSMSSSCTPWTECSVVKKPGSSTSDPICGRRSRLSLIGSVIVCIVVAMYVIVLAREKEKMEEIKKHRNNGSINSPPVQEQGTRSV